MLRVNKLQLSSAGTYTLKVSNGNLTQTENFTLIVRSEPTVKASVINSQGLYNLGQEYTLKCDAQGYPIPEIEWLFKACSSFTECDPSSTQRLEKLLQKRHRNTLSRVSVIQRVAHQSGMFSCQACNKLGCTFAHVPFFVTDVPDGGFSVSGPNNVLVGENITLKCSASLYNFSLDSLEWYKDTLNGEKRLVNNANSRYKVTDTSTDFSFSKELSVPKVTLGDKGRYVCRGRLLKSMPYQSSTNRRSSFYGQENNLQQELSFKLNVLPLEPPVFIQTNLLPSVAKDTQPLIVENPKDGVQLVCRVAGRPLPHITWYLNGVQLKPTVNTTRVQLTDDNQIVRINYLSSEDEGLYECKAENKVSFTQAAHLVQLRTTAERDALYANISIPVIIAVVIALLLVIVLLIIAKVCYQKSRQKSASPSGPWKEPATPPTPRLTQFELPMTTPQPSSSHYTNEDDECRVTLTSNRDDGSISPVHSLSHHGHQCCNGSTIYASRCHYPAPHEMLPTCHVSKFSICECSAQTLPHGTMERPFPHLYPKPNFINGAATMMRQQQHYDTHRSRSHSPSRRSAEY
jgi:hypothetical protein